jgi:uncharacterized protein (TIGR00251 family)
MPIAKQDPKNPDSVLLAIKAVPGAKRDTIAGVLDMPTGPRLKVRTSAPPEGGKANKAICKLVANALGIKPASVTLVSGPSNPEKVLRIEGSSIDAINGLAS